MQQQQRGFSEGSGVWGAGRVAGAKGVGGGTHAYLLEGLLPGVRAYVVVERGGAGEGAAAVAAFKGPVAGVRHHVVPQVRRLGEGLGAVATLVRPDTAHRGQQTEDRNESKLFEEEENI